MNEELIGALEELEKVKGIPKEVVFDALESALISSYKKNFGTSQNVKIDIDRTNGNISLYSMKKVVNDEDLEDDKLEIPLSLVRKLDPKIEVDDIYTEKLKPANFGRIAAQTAKQVVIQRIKDAEREVIYNDYSDRENEIITGQVQRISYGSVYFDLGETEAVLPPAEQIKTEEYKQGDRLKLLLIQVKKTTKGPQVILSRSHPNLVKRLFELEVPEIAEGIVEIYSIAREAGSRTKIAVFSRDEEVDPLGACVGYKGSRVKAIVDELHDEKIDIVIYEKPIEVFIANSLSPSKVEKVFVNEKEKSALVIVPDYQLSLAIGKEGQNARLAAKLTNWKIDIKSVEQFQKYLEEQNITEEELENSFKSMLNTEEKEIEVDLDRETSECAQEETADKDEILPCDTNIEENIENLNEVK
ncbi:transcription termination factor NusA [Peptoniphilus catoniae]|uniref:transcription termination factor NusA n=1 Tax=Peptoniphilus catoniae TaxID=1660341 RepID=UPI0010FDF9FB|nr:transcription termination factor NusA [Peptoniphilus catoniae]